MAKEDYPSDWQKRRRKVFQRDKWVCQFCGVRPEGGSSVSFHCHHIKPISKGGSNAYENLTTVCGDCHRKIHSGDLPTKSEWQLEPVKTSECPHCSSVAPVSEFTASFCSDRCFCKRKAEKFHNFLQNDVDCCMTCYTRLDGDKDVCSRCGNWELSKDKSDSMVHVNYDIEEFTLQLCYWSFLS